jgi:hypothetical protein
MSGKILFSAFTISALEAVWQDVRLSKLSKESPFRSPERRAGLLLEL